MFSIGVDSHWIAYQTVKDRYGFLSLLGHGAMVSRECYVAAGGFPHVVAEDLCFSIAARDAGWLTVFAPDVVCEEEYPVDYLAFKKRHSKWTQGNMEFIKRYTAVILRSRMSWLAGPSTGAGRPPTVTSRSSARPVRRIGSCAVEGTSMRSPALSSREANTAPPRSSTFTQTGSRAVKTTGPPICPAAVGRAGVAAAAWGRGGATSAGAMNCG